VIAPVAVSNDALVEDLDGDRKGLVQTHEELARLLMAHGELVHASTADRDAFIRAVRRLMVVAPDAAKYWEEVLAHGRWGTVDGEQTLPLSEVFDLKDLQNQWRDFIDVAFMERTRAELLGCPLGQAAWRDAESGIEIAHCGANWETPTFRLLRELADEQTISGGTERDSIAKRRFIPLIAGSRHIAILDQWLGNGLAKQHLAAKAKSTPTPQELQWLLGLIDKHSNQTTVSIFTACEHSATAGEPSSKEIVAAFTDLWERLPKGGGVTALRLFLGRGGSKFPHDRHIRFDATAGFALSAGFDRLRSERTRANTRWRLTYFWRPDQVRGLIDDEDKAREITGAPRSWKR